jgi:hypothetical protein
MPMAAAMRVLLTAAFNIEWIQNPIFYHFIGVYTVFTKYLGLNFLQIFGAIGNFGKWQLIKCVYIVMVEILINFFLHH